MESPILKKYEHAGAIWSSAIKLAQKKCKSGAKLLDLAESIEGFIREEGAQPAFPVNLSVNEEAAHFTPKWKDEAKLKESDLLKIDVGVSVEGYICDGALSVNLDNTYAKQIEANELALQNAISVVKWNEPIDFIGTEIEHTLKAAGFNPVYNLGGHGLEKNDIHAQPGIPNHSNGSKLALEEGVIAIEPFASTGKGFVNETAHVEIFAVERTTGVRNANARKLLDIAQGFGELPFAERWLRAEAEKKKMDDFQVTTGLKELMKAGCLHSHAGLREQKSSMVSQAEKSLVVLEDEVIVLGE